MSLQQIKNLKNEKGFTIVELLIVIVVIGILAAIVIVAYNGIQNQARNTKYKTDASTLVKIAEAVNAGDGSTGGAYPSGGDTNALVNSFNSTTTTKLPTDVTVLYTASAPTDATAVLNSADLAIRAYNVQTCPNGVNVYYPVRGTTTTIATIKAGQGC